jgi:D-lactate dehydrogenase
MTRPRVAFFDTKPYDEEYFTQVSGSQLDITYFRFPLNTSVAQVAQGAFAVCCFVHDKLDRECLRILKEGGVRVVAMRCAGFNEVDLEAAAELGIIVTRVPAYSPNAVAEHAAALLLTLVRRIHRAYNRIRDHNFSLAGFVGFDIAGKTVGLIGCGKIGQKAAQIFRGFEARVITYDPMADSEWAAARGVTITDLDTLLRESDIISLHVPLTPESRYIIRAETLAKMKPGVVIINTSRGELVNTEDLIASLRSGKIGGVGLDVYEEEEEYFYSDHSGTILDDERLAYLLTFPNVLVTAHQAFLTKEALTQIASVSVVNILAAHGHNPFLKDTVLTAPPA